MTLLSGESSDIIDENFRLAAARTLLRLRKLEPNRRDEETLRLPSARGVRASGCKLRERRIGKKDGNHLMPIYNKFEGNQQRRQTQAQKEGR